MSEIDKDTHKHEENQAKIQQTFAMIKPDATGAHQTDAIIKIIEDSGIKIVMMKQFVFNKESASYFYDEHRNTSFFESLVEFMTSGHCVGLVLECPDAIKTWRQMIGPTNVMIAKDQAPKSIRALFGDTSNPSKNACHGSDSVTSAKREIDFLYKMVQL